MVLNILTINIIIIFKRFIMVNIKNETIFNTIVTKGKIRHFFGVRGVNRKIPLKPFEKT